MKTVVLKKEAESLVSSGTLTIYSKWVKKVHAEPGDFVRVYVDDEPIGVGFYEGIGAIGVRILSFEEHLDLLELLEHKIFKALKVRERLKVEGSFRLVNAEGDGLPGLIVDVYNDIAVIQSSSIGFDKNVEVIANILRKLLNLKTVYLRCDQRSRREVGLPIVRKPLYGNNVRTIIEEGNARFYVDVEKGQKTGFFLDQRVNRLYLGEIVWERSKVLDLYSYTGGFAIHALHSKAKEAVLVEESPYAVEEAYRNLKLNKVHEKARIVNARVESFLEAIDEKYDVVIVDPPALIPALQYKEGGLKAYRSLYSKVFNIVEEDGILVASSCSYFLSQQEFIDLIEEVALKSGREVRIFKISSASSDHLSRPQDDFLRYLKVLFLNVT